MVYFKYMGVSAMARDNRFERKLTQDNFATERVDVIQNRLLGSYDDDGNYIIAQKIIEELIELEKVKKTVFGNSIFCVGNLLGYGELVFELLFDTKTSGNTAAATLYLLEDVDKINGYLQNTIKTKLEDFNRHVDNFIEATYQHFNISTDEDDDEDEGKERKLLDDLNNEDSFILAKKQFSLLLEKLLSEKYLDAYGKYFTARMSELTKLNNEFSQGVLDRFKSQYALIENVFLHEKNYKTLNELLDKCIEEVSGTSEQLISQEQEFNNKIAPALETFTDSIEKLHDKYEPKALNMLEKDDREKVEEILDNVEDHQEKKDNTRESKPNVQQIVNEVKSNNKQEDIVRMSQDNLEKRDNANYIQNMLNTKKQVKEEIISNLHSGEGSTFATKNASSYGYIPSGDLSGAKVVDTSRSGHLEDPGFKEKSATSSLQNRINRLQKFKETSSPSASSDTLENMYDILAREKEIKSTQVEEKNFRTRETMDMLTNEKDISEYLRRKSMAEKSIDDMGMDR